MTEYKLTVPNSAQDFQYGKKTYNGGSTFHTDDPCEAIRFYNAVRTTNPNMPRGDGTRNFWRNVDNACQTQVAASPQPAPATSPVDSKPTPTGGDTPSQQGAPKPPVSGTVGGTSTPSGTTGADSPPAPSEEPTRPPDGEPHPSHGGEQPQEQTDAGDPVDIYNGALYLQETDLEIPNTILPLTLSRFYRSGAASHGPFGWNWDHNHNLFIRELQNGDIALWRNLHEDVFVFDGANFEPPRGIFERLVRVAGLAQVFEIMGAGGIVMRFERPAGWIDGERIPIIWARDRHGNQLSYSYGAEDKLIEVADDDGRFIRFEYDQCGLLVSVFDHSGRRYTYYHNEETQHLVCVSSPPTTDHPEGIIRIYHYEKPFALPELRHNIIRVEDSMGNVYLENKYEQDPASWHFARITEQLYGGFLYQFRYTQLQWVPANPVYINIPAVRVEVMNPDFGLETYTFNYRGDLLDRRYRLNKDKSFRVVVWQYEFDEQGNPSVTTKPDGSQEINTYDFVNPDPRMRRNLLQKELTSASGFPSPSRIVWRAKYESIYQLIIEEKNELAAVTEYKYDFNLNPGAVNNSGKVLEVHHPDVTLPDGTTQSNVSKFENNDKGQVTARIQADGVRHEMSYGNTGNAKSRLSKQIFDAADLGIENSLKYDTIGFVGENTDGNGNSTKKVTNALGLLEKIILPPINGGLTEYRFHYNSDKKVVNFERPKGNYMDATLADSHIIDKFERDVLGYPINYSLSSNTEEERILRVCSDFRGLPVETTKPDGSKIKRLFDERGLLISEEVIGRDGNQLTSKSVYDRSGKLVQETNSFGQTTKYEYDGFSRINKITLPNNTQIKHTWIKGDLLESEEVVGDDGTGVIRQLSLKTNVYDEKGRKISEIVKTFEDDPTVSVDVATTFFYDQLDLIEKIVDNRGGIRTFHHDGIGRIIKEIDPMGNEERFVYDNNENVVQIESHNVEPDGSTSIITKKFTYDARNRRIGVIEPDGAKFIFKYDDRNLFVKQTDYLGINQELKYDSFNNIVEKKFDVGGLNITHKWILDNMSRMTSYVDPTGQISRYHLDGVGRIYKTEYPNGFSSTRVFNNVGQIKEEVLGSGVKFEYGYDSANRLLSIKNTGVPASINQVQPHEFNYDGLDRVVSAKIGINEVVRNYDSRSRLLLERTSGKDMVCNYNDNTGTVEKIWPDGRTEKYSHDLNGIITTIEETTNGSLGTGANLIASIKPSGNNYFGEAFYQGGLKVSNKYDERKRLVELALSSPAGLDEKIKCCYDKANRLQVEAILGQKSKISYFEFDNKNRLTLTKDGFGAVVPNVSTQTEHNVAINTIKVAAASATHEEKFEYTPSDARTKYTETGSAVKNYAYLSGHRIQNDGTNNYIHHTDGTLQSDGLFTYDADALGRIVTIKSGINEVCKIEYDAFGRPSIIKELGKPDKSINYLGGFVEQENENGIASKQISMHPVTGVPIAYHSAIGTHYTLFDSRYNLVGLANTNGDLLETYRYKSFGVPEIYDSAGNVLVTSNFGIEPFFGGQKFLSSTGLYLSKRRLMNPRNGVFLSADTRGYADSPSLYVYVAQNPANNIDPNGEIVPFIVAAFVIGGALAGAGYSFYDAYHHPERYRGAAGFWRPLANTFGGAAIGGASILAGEAVLGLGGVGIFASSSAATAGTLTATQTFVLYGTSTATIGLFLRTGGNQMAPECVDPASPGTIATDYVIGGGLGVVFRGLGILASRNTTWTLQGDREAILESRRIWGQTEGSVYGMDTPNLPTWRATGGGNVSPNSAIFRFSGENNILRPHEITGPFSLLKRLLGQSKAGFGDIAFNEATQIGTRMVAGNEIPIYNLTGVRLLPGEFAGQSAAWAASRLWGRRILDITLTGGFLAAFGLNINNDYGFYNEEEKPKK